MVSTPPHSSLQQHPKHNSITLTIKLILLWGFCSIFVFHSSVLKDFSDVLSDEDIDIFSGSSESTGNIPLEENDFLESNKEGDIERTQRAHKQTLILHVGPQKTGSTSVQLNVIRDKKFRKILQSDHFQEIVSFEFASFENLRKKCLAKGPDECDYAYVNELKTAYEEAYNKTAAASNSSATSDDVHTPIYHTLHTNEEWSILPESNFTFSLLKDIFSPWDEVHIILFYRPFLDWINSIYLQYRKRFLIRPRSRDASSFWKQDYLIGRDEQILFPQYFRHLLDTDALRDTYATYEFYEHFVSYLEQGQQQQLQNNHKGTKVHIHKLQMLSREGIEHEFICNLPGAKMSCEYAIKQQIEFPHRNNGQIIPINLDLLVIEAWHQNLISIKRHDAVVALERKMLDLKMNILDLPHVCITSDEEQWILDRGIRSERKFGHERNLDELMGDVQKRFHSSLEQKKLCSVNASASLEMESFRTIFKDCIFQSPTLLNRILKDGGPNPLWDELDCSGSIKNAEAE